VLWPSWSRAVLLWLWLGWRVELFLLASFESGPRTETTCGADSTPPIYISTQNIPVALTAAAAGWGACALRTAQLSNPPFLALYSSCSYIILSIFLLSLALSSSLALCPWYIGYILYKSIQRVNSRTQQKNETRIPQQRRQHNSSTNADSTKHRTAAAPNAHCVSYPQCLSGIFSPSISKCRSIPPVYSRLGLPLQLEREWADTRQTLQTH
jgi:hypothetical protein